MQDELDAHGVRIVALSKDSVADVNFHHDRDGASLGQVTLLADPELAVIRTYGVEHHKAIEFSTGRFQLLGVPLALVPSVKTMAIPTTVLVDEQGIVRWIDQSEDYRLRSDNDLVLGAVRDVFPPG
ncbi:MAG: redoxin domain-containing protein [Deltaproteobacteria bacterium]|nr:MAG: redoxin domain-containing protein [Deltaproteobacteria bacterium]